ncbi:MAG: hypothetical protein RMM58_12035 [Chloroflexota bacterium]|nr:hypothetical protein [Dehalococcoidia bacterium]MDW8254596.1 hypothetical protein [Chloroflexota bacterium]
MDDLRRALAAADALREALYEYGVDDEEGRFQSARALAWQQFFGPLIPIGQLPDDHPDWDAYDDWFLFDYRLVENGKTPFELFLAGPARTLPPEQRALAETWQNDRLGVFAVESVGHGGGAVLRDLKDGAQLTVPNVPLSRHGLRWDYLIGRLVPVGEVWGFAAPPRHLLPPLADRLPADFIGREPPAADRRARAIELWRAVRRIAAEQPAVPMTEEGDPVRPSRVRYQLADPARAAAALRAQPFLQVLPDAPPGEQWLVWQGIPPGLSTRDRVGKVDLAVIRLRDDEVTIETLTPQRLDRARARVLPLLGEARVLEETIGAPVQNPDAVARARAAGLIVGGILQALAANRRLDALQHALPGSEAAVLLEQFDREPFGLLAGLHHPGQIGLNDVLLTGDLAGVELRYEQPGVPTRYAQARLRETPTGWMLEAIRPGRLGEQPADALTTPELAALWHGDWQWAPIGPAGSDPVLGVALKRLYLAARPILVQVLAIRLWQDFSARSAPEPVWDAERWAIGVEHVAAWQAGLADEPTMPTARRIIETLALAPRDPRYAFDQPVLHR